MNFKDTIKNQERDFANFDEISVKNQPICA